MAGAVGFGLLADLLEKRVLKPGRAGLEPVQRFGAEQGPPKTACGRAEPDIGVSVGNHAACISLAPGPPDFLAIIYGQRRYMFSEGLEARLKARESSLMNKQIVHWLALPVFMVLALMPAPAAHGQYQAEGEFADTRSQDYLRDVISLASTLGSAHAIRLVCNGRDDQYWRSYMQELLGLEAPYRGSLRSSMVDAFNSAYSAESARRTVCDAGAVSAEKMYASTGQRLSNALAQANLPSGVREPAGAQATPY